MCHPVIRHPPSAIRSCSVIALAPGCRAPAHPPPAGRLANGRSNYKSDRSSATSYELRAGAGPPLLAVRHLLSFLFLGGCCWWLVVSSHCQTRTRTHTCTKNETNREQSEQRRARRSLPLPPRGPVLQVGSKSTRHHTHTHTHGFNAAPCLCNSAIA